MVRRVLISMVIAGWLASQAAALPHSHTAGEDHHGHSPRPHVHFGGHGHAHPHARPAQPVSSGPLVGSHDEDAIWLSDAITDGCGPSAGSNAGAKMWLPLAVEPPPQTLGLAAFREGCFHPPDTPLSSLLYLRLRL